MVPTALLFVVCQAVAAPGPRDVNGFPVDGSSSTLALPQRDRADYDPADVEGVSPVPDFSNPNVCSRVAMRETPHWQDAHPGWYVLRVKCPHPDGTFPGDMDV